MSDLPDCLRVLVGDDHCRFVVGDQDVAIPVGAAVLATSHLHSDPPAPAELTNAIGVVLDYLDDAGRDLPAIAATDDVRISGADPTAIASVEAGWTVTGTFELSRAAAEDVFRTLATERRPVRARNPGLAPQRLDTVVAGCCIVVALMRHLQLDMVTVDDSRDDDRDIEPEPELSGPPGGVS